VSFAMYLAVSSRFSGSRLPAPQRVETGDDVEKFLVDSDLTQAVKRPVRVFQQLDFFGNCWCRFSMNAQLRIGACDFEFFNTIGPASRSLPRSLAKGRIWETVAVYPFDSDGIALGIEPRDNRIHAAAASLCGSMWIRGRVKIYRVGPSDGNSGNMLRISVSTRGARWYGHGAAPFVRAGAAVAAYIAVGVGILRQRSDRRASCRQARYPSHGQRKY